MDVMIRIGILIPFAMLIIKRTLAGELSSAASSAAQKGLQPFSFISYFPSIKKLHKA